MAKQPIYSVWNGAEKEFEGRLSQKEIKIFKSKGFLVIKTGSYIKSNF